MCKDTCNDSGRGQKGICDDGSDDNGLDPNVIDRSRVKCDLGTDCSDCGIRLFCISCPSQCYTQALTRDDPDGSCFEHMYSSDICWPQCNTAECGHKSCTTEAAVQVCREEEDRLQNDYASSPVELPEVHIFKGDSETANFFGQFKIKTNTERGSGVLVSFNLDYKLEWNDTRLATSPCRLVVDTMLSSIGSSDSKYTDTYWRPTLEVSTPIESPTVDNMVVSTFSHIFDATYSRSTLALRRSIQQPMDLDYTFFPFDYHILPLNIEIPSTQLTGCDELIENLRQVELLPESERGVHKLLPTSGTWLFYECGTAGGGCTQAQMEKDIFVDRALQGSGNTTAGTNICPIRIKIKRSNMIFIIKQLLPLMIIAEAPLIALWLNPNIPGLVGARCSLSILAMVLVLLSANKDLGLGKLQGIIWTDEFALVQFGIILIALFETIFVHAQMRLGRTVLANAVDSVFRKLLPFAVYPFVVAGWVLKGNQMYTLSILVTTSGTLGFAFLGALFTFKRYVETGRRRNRAVDALVKLDIINDDEEKAAIVMQEAFECFDVDDSKKLERKEVRLILNKMYPRMTRKQQLSAMREIQDEEIPFEGFADAVEAWHNIAVRPPEPEKKPPTIFDRLSIGSRRSKVGTGAGAAGWEKAQKAQLMTKYWAASASDSRAKAAATGKTTTSFQKAMLQDKKKDKAGVGFAASIKKTSQTKKPKMDEGAMAYNPDTDDGGGF